MLGYAVLLARRSFISLPNRAVGLKQKRILVLRSLVTGTRKRASFATPGSRSTLSIYCRTAWTAAVLARRL